MFGPVIQAFFDRPTNTVTYLVGDPVTKRAAIIDPVFDYDHSSGRADTASADLVLAAAKEAGVLHSKRPGRRSLEHRRRQEIAIQ